MRPIVADRVAWSVGLSVGLSVCLSILSVTLMSPAKTATPIEMPFGLRTRVGPRNHVLDGGPDPPWKEQFWGGKGCPIVKYGALCGYLCKNGWTDRDAVWVVGSDEPKKSCVKWCSRFPHWKGQLFWKIGAPIVKYRVREQATVCQMGTQLPPRKGA